MADVRVKRKGHKRWIGICLGIVGVLCTDATSLKAQAPELAIGTEVRRDRFTYHFDNPSSADTPSLVPHFFEQRYRADNLWLVATVGYTAVLRFETSAGMTPTRDSIADDYDTFFDPDGSVIVGGTTGPAAMRSVEFRQRVEVAHAGPLAIAFGYRLRMDSADFGVGHKTTTRNGVLVEAIDVTTRESTTSTLHEIFVGAALARDLGAGWRLTIEGLAAPSAVARLTVDLPDKYPGQRLEYQAAIGSATGRVTLARRRGRWTIDLSSAAGRTWSYDTAARLSREVVAVRAQAGRAW